MKNNTNVLRRMRYLLPRMLLWFVCLVYLVITFCVAFNLFPEYYYPLAYLRKTDPFISLGW